MKCYISLIAFLISVYYSYVERKSIPSGSLLYYSNMEVSCTGFGSSCDQDESSLVIGTKPAFNERTDFGAGGYGFTGTSLY